MKRFIGYKTAVILIVGVMVLTGLSILGPVKSLAAEMDPVLALATPLVKMSKKAEVVIMGTGFKPGQVLNILFTAADGTLANIGLDIKADATGSFGDTWKAGRYISKKLITGGAYKLEVTDTDYNTITQNVGFFVK